MITRDDVAKYAGVSKSTISRVLNNNGYVSKENRDKIENAINNLGYTPNLIARSLRTKETRQILFFVPELSNPFYMEVYQGMEDYAEENGYTIVVSRHYDHNMIKQRQYDGIILSQISPELQFEFQSLGIPVVVTYYGSQPLSIPFVSINIEEGAKMAMNYLIHNGHKKIAFITNENLDDQRFLGYSKGIEILKLQCNQRYVKKCTDNSSGYHQGYAAANELIDSGLDITAIFAFNDIIATGSIAAIMERGIKVPDQISIIGFDDILQSQFTCPPLTTIRMPKYEQGWESARTLISLINGETVKPIDLNTKLIVRRSVINVNE